MTLTEYTAFMDAEAPSDDDREICDCGAAATERYFGRNFCRACVAFMEAQNRPRCATCGDTGTVPVGAAGNMDFETTCPDCGPDCR
jgi:hypothetical protein